MYIYACVCVRVVWFTRGALQERSYGSAEAGRNVKWMLLQGAAVIVRVESVHGRIGRFQFINVPEEEPTMVARLPQQVLLLLVLGESEILLYLTGVHSELEVQSIGCWFHRVRYEKSTIPRKGILLSSDLVCLFFHNCCPNASSDPSFFKVLENLQLPVTHRGRGKSGLKPKDFPFLALKITNFFSWIQFDLWYVKRDESFRIFSSLKKDI